MTDDSMNDPLEVHKELIRQAKEYKRKHGASGEVFAYSANTKDLAAKRAKREKKERKLRKKQRKIVEELLGKKEPGGDA